MNRTIEWRRFWITLLLAAAAYDTGWGGDADSDADGVPDAGDNCPVIFNPDQRDDDGNGFGYACDAAERAEAPADSLPATAGVLGLLYDVDFGTPPHTVNQIPVTGQGPAPRITPTFIWFGQPLVVNAVSVLTDQPLEFDTFGNGGSYEQLTFGLGAYYGDGGFSMQFPAYRFEMDVVVESLMPPGVFKLFIDAPQANNIEFKNGSIGVIVLAAPAYTQTIGTYQAGVAIHVVVVVDMLAPQWTIFLNNTQAFQGPFYHDPGGPMRMLRPSLSPSFGSRIGLDNVQIEAPELGACCDGSNRTCTDSVAPADCDGPQQTWVHGELCQVAVCDFEGACCHGETGFCQNQVLEEYCAGPQTTWHPGLRCSDLSPPCERHRGACCDHTSGLGGLCTDETFPENCSGAQQEWIKDALCADVACNEATGSCCNTLTGGCSEGVIQGECTGPQRIWTKDTPCSQVGCTAATGACCDTLTGVCTDGVIQAECTGPQRIWTKNGACTVAGCTAVTGACCDTLTGDCTDGVIQAGCTGPQRIWSKNTPCSEAGCAAVTGACCDTLSGSCTDNVIQAECNGPQQIWTKNTPCSQTGCTAVTGACCDRNDGSCTTSVEAECRCGLCEWTKLGDCADVTCEIIPIPTVSGWGLAILTLVILTGAKLGSRARTPDA